MSSQWSNIANPPSTRSGIVVQVQQQATPPPEWLPIAGAVPSVADSIKQDNVFIRLVTAQVGTGPSHEDRAKALLASVADHLPVANNPQPVAAKVMAANALLLGLELGAHHLSKDSASGDGAEPAVVPLIDRTLSCIGMN